MSGPPPTLPSTLLPRARARISGTALRQNLEGLSRQAGTPLILPVKADAYGHGLEAVVGLTQALPQLWGYAVATPLEAARLSRLAPGRPVLLLTPADPGEMGELADLGVRLNVSNIRELEALPPHARVHLKVDTGMNRLGARPEEAVELGRRLAARGQLEGVYSHFARAEDPDPGPTQAQLERFMEVLAGLPPVLAHIANGAGVLSLGRLPGMSLARPGIASYGISPAPELSGVLPLRPAMTLEARVGSLRVVPAGESVGYGGLWTARRDTEVATLQLGYADGYPRNASGRAQLLVAGERRDVLGRICMDQLMLDISGLGVQPGEKGVHPSEVAEWSGINEYELLTGVGSRVERVAEG